MSKYRLQTGNLNISCSWWEEMLLSYHMDSSEAIITSNASVVFYFSYIAPWNSTKNSLNEISPTHYFPLFPSASRFLSSLSESDVSVIIMNHAPSHIFLLCLHHSAVLRTEHFLQKTPWVCFYRICSGACLWMWHKFSGLNIIIRRSGYIKIS